MKGVKSASLEKVNDAPAGTSLLRTRTLAESKAKRGFPWWPVVSSLLGGLFFAEMMRGREWQTYLWAVPLALFLWAVMMAAQVWGPRQKQEQWVQGHNGCGECRSWPMVDKYAKPDNPCGAVLRMDVPVNIEFKEGDTTHSIHVVQASARCDRKWSHIGHPHAAKYDFGYKGLYGQPTLLMWWGDSDVRDRRLLEWRRARYQEMRAAKAADALDAGALVAVFGESRHAINPDALHVRCGLCMGAGLSGIVEYGSRNATNPEAEEWNEEARRAACYDHRAKYHPGAPCAFIEDRLAAAPVNFWAISEMCPGGCCSYAGKCVTADCKGVA